MKKTVIQIEKAHNGFIISNDSVKLIAIDGESLTQILAKQLSLSLHLEDAKTSDVFNIEFDYGKEAK